MQGQAIPLVLTTVIFALLSLFIYGEIVAVNHFTALDIMLVPRWSDVLVGLTIYLKTSVDFAIFIGNLMSRYNTLKGRIAIETGTALGNAAGTAIVLFIWNVFREVRVLLALMVFVASIVLFKLAQDGLEHAHGKDAALPWWFYRLVNAMQRVLYRVNKITGRLLDVLIPDLSLRPKSGLTFAGLLAFSFTIPFILGLDDFAGYVPLFNIVNVFGFAIGVLAGHMILNIFLFLSPTTTIRVVRHPVISFIGSVAFVALGVWGLLEAYGIMFGHSV